MSRADGCQPSPKRIRRFPQRPGDQHVPDIGVRARSERPTEAETANAQMMLKEMLDAQVEPRIARGRAAQTNPSVVALAIAMHGEEKFTTDEAAFKLFGLRPNTQECREKWLPRLRRLDNYKKGAQLPVPVQTAAST